MKRIRFHYSCNFAGTDGYEDCLMEDDSSEQDLERTAEEVMNMGIAPEYHYEEIADDNESWEGE